MIYNELVLHGTEDFPFGVYHLDKPHPRYEMTHHWHDNFEIIQVEYGTLDLYLNNRHYVLRPGAVAVANRGVVHGAHPTDAEYNCLVFSLPYLKSGSILGDKIIDEFFSGERMFVEYTEDEDISRATAEVFRSMRRTEAHPFSAIEKIYGWLSLYLDKGLYTESNRKIELRDNESVVKLKKALHFIRENYHESITLDDIAKTTGFSTKYFCSFFHNHTGQTAARYLIEERIQNAAKQLLISDKSITEIAYACGFNDLSYFIRTFKRNKGVTPNEYRKSGKYDL